MYEGSNFSTFLKKYIYLLIYFGCAGPQLRHADSQLRHACGIQFPDQGWNPGPLHWERGVPLTGPPGKSLYIFTNTFYCLLTVAVTVGVIWYLIVVLICISLTTNNVVHLFMSVEHIYHLWRNVYSSPLPIFYNPVIWLFFVLFYYCRVLGVLYIFLILTSYQVYDLQTFSPIL